MSFSLPVRRRYPYPTFHVATWYLRHCSLTQPNKEQLSPETMSLAIHNNNNNDSFSDDDSDSDDFLVSTTAAASATSISTLSDGGGDGADREALVRKKLLENFYGKSTSIQGTNDGVEDDGVGGRPARTVASRNSRRRPDIVDNEDQVDDIDSKAFDRNKFVTQHIRSSSVQALLEVEEQLSLQVRTFDSTMQTLVYENYTKFIDVTNAIKSIGTTVTTTNEEQIQQLITCTNSIYQTSRMMMDGGSGGGDHTIGTIRQQVVEKIRIQRLLQRLNTLFILPNTIRQYIQQQQYTTAITKYNQASMILAKYHPNAGPNQPPPSTTFESFSSITSECIVLLQQLNGQLHHQFQFWSGRSVQESNEPDDPLNQKNDDDDDDEKDVPVPELPKSMAEVYESARALSMLHELFGNEQSRTIDRNHHLAIEDELLYSMSLSAATRLLDRLLDAHSIQVQEYKLMNHHSVSNMVAGDDSQHEYSHNSTSRLLGHLEEQAPPPLNAEGSTSHDDEAAMNFLIPSTVLVAVLECAALYQKGFPSQSTNHDSSERNYDLIEFITESYTSFISHVRSILLQDDGGGSLPSIGAGMNTDNAILESDQIENNISSEEISKALSVLVQYVQVFTNRLVDEVHLNVDFTNRLMQQAIDLASSLVRRRVDNQFRSLRYSVVNDCLLPFANRIVKERERIISSGSDKNDDESNMNQVLPEIIRIASSTLSDSLQLVDDTIRSIFSDSTSSTSTTIDDKASNAGTVPSDVQDAVQASTYRLVSWLANTFEVIVGGDPTDYNHIAEAQQQAREDIGSNNDAITLSNKAVAYESIGDSCEDELLALLYTARDQIYEECDGTIHSDIVLAMIELCRLSETLVPQQIEQSLQYGGGKKKSVTSQRDLFPSSQEGTISTASITRKNGNSSSHLLISKRFQVAGSRIFSILIMNTAFEASHRLLSTVNSESAELDGQRPSDNVLAVVQYAKSLSLQCATLFGGTKRAGPVPIWDETIFNSGSMISAAGMLSNRKSGLYLDVERMFKEKVTIYSHPSDVLEYSRDTALFIYFKIVLRSWYENIREYASTTFSSNEYMQMQIDIIFIKYIIPHYLSNDYHDHNNNGTNGRTALTTLMNDVLEAVDDRHQSADHKNNHTYGRDNDDIQRNARNIVRSFMVSVESDVSVADTFIVKES